jgi:hypothetical protein
MTKKQIARTLEIAFPYTMKRSPRPHSPSLAPRAPKSGEFTRPSDKGSAFGQCYGEASGLGWLKTVRGRETLDAEGDAVAEAGGGSATRNQPSLKCPLWARPSMLTALRLALRILKIAKISNIDRSFRKPRGNLK